MTDYYKILGVDHNASDDEIRKAYRKMSRKYHPDIAGAEFEEKFKEVNAAYDVLSNPEKRRMVDMGVDPNDPSAGSAGASGAGFADMGMGDIFSQFFGGSFGTSQGPISRVQPGEDSLAEAKIDLKTAIFGGNVSVRITAFGVCQDCSGSGSADSANSAPEQCSQCHGTGFCQKVVRTMLGQMVSSMPCDKCEGHGTIIKNPCQNCRGRGRVRAVREVGVNVPAGIRDGSRLRLASQGSVGECGGPAGDLYVDIHIRADKQFTRNGDDLHCWITVPMSWAVLGHDVEIETFDGSQKLEIPAGCQSDDTVTLENLGVTKLRSKDRGNIIVHVLVQIPTKLSAEERSLISKFANLHDGDVKHVKQNSLDEQSGERKGFFSKLKEAFAG
ncbi:chaperone protein DnaJ [Gardnerella vaginalis 1500E]|uniref:Chaperone protein DnaJ n=1 Tax=Gardnerella vaginalis 1500E TaxID=698957 RepID=I4M2Y6_GARVA|nr:molecular chaperone DnaJ [Gardnerella vaginalis]EIK83576.1 chaperone protein DnaJ [Gardnerella vaginalis 1500E]